MKHEIEKLIWRKEQSLGLGDDEHLNHEQIGELMVEHARAESRKACDLVLDKLARGLPVGDMMQFHEYKDEFQWSHADHNEAIGITTEDGGNCKDSFYKYIGMEW